MKTILIVDDEKSIVESIKYNLEKNAFSTLVAFDGEKALKIAREQKPDLIILDLMLPRASGEEVCRLIRKESSVPIIMLTAKDAEVEKVVGLEIGADDYITKPFSMRELIARVKAILRRAEPGVGEGKEETEFLEVGPLSMNLKRHQVKLSENELVLPLKEFEILKLFLKNHGQVLTRDFILRKVWGEDYFGGTKTVDVHIRRLREKIEEEPSKPKFIHTVRGVGYRFELRK